MSDPIADAPPPEVQDAGGIDASFPPGPPVASLCGFAIPNFFLIVKWRLPAFALPAIPTLFLALGLNCDLSNPLKIATFTPGGGRTSSADPDPDDDFN